MKKKLEIIPITLPTSHRTGYLPDSWTRRQINSKLGFVANHGTEWEFQVTLPNKKKVKCAIWAYKGVRWSTFGPQEAFDLIFGSDDGA